MKLKRFLLRYYPPGIILEYEANEELRQKTIDLLELSVEYVCLPLWFLFVYHRALTAYSSHGFIPDFPLNFV